MTVEKAINFVKKSVFPAVSWPLPPTATSLDKFKFNLHWCFMMLCVLCFLLPLLYSISVHRDDILIVSTCICYVIGCSGALSRGFIFKFHRKRLQSLIWEMENFVKIAESQERKILERYVDEYSGFHCSTIVISSMAAISVILGPILVPEQKYPTPADYPFENETGGLIYYFLYLLQAIACVQDAAAANTDSQTAFIFWFICSRLEMLAEEFENVRDHSQLNKIVDKHQHLLRYAKEATNIMAYVAFTIAACGYVIIIASCLILVDDYPIAVKMQLIPMAGIGVAWIFLCAWPADHLMESCNLVGTAAYNSGWPDMSPEMRKSVLFVLQRSQEPVIVSIGGFIPTLSLQFYRCYLSGAVSYLMTLRIVIAAGN